MPEWNALYKRYMPTDEDIAAQKYQDAEKARKDALGAEARRRQQAQSDLFAAQQREDFLRQQANAQREREDMIKRRRELADRAAAQSRADSLIAGVGGFGGGGSGGGGGGSMGALGTYAGGGGGVPAGGGGGVALQAMPDTTAADSAARTAAKERAALRLQSSMRGLDTAMGTRGIRSSGLHAQGISSLLGDSASDEAMSELERLQSRTGAEMTIGGRNQDAINSRAIADMQAQQWAAERADKLASEQRQLALTLAQFGMRY